MARRPDVIVNAVLCASDVFASAKVEVGGRVNCTMMVRHEQFDCSFAISSDMRCEPGEELELGITFLAGAEARAKMKEGLKFKLYRRKKLFAEGVVVAISASAQDGLLFSTEPHR